jgi:thiamine pyrophosphokinase
MEGFLLRKTQLRTIIFANGTLADLKTAQEIINPGNLIIAADGGTLHCLALGITPQVVIGDFDSLDEATLTKLQTQGVKFMRYPAQKNETDLELALQYASEQGSAEILVFGALGVDRWDMTLGNLLLLAHPGLTQTRVVLVDSNQEIFLLHPGQTLVIHGRPGDTVSLVPVQGDASGITTLGLEYPLQEGTLHFGFTRGISNTFLEDTASIHLKHGFLICIIIHHSADIASPGQPATS